MIVRDGDVHYLFWIFSGPLSISLDGLEKYSKSLFLPVTNWRRIASQWKETEETGASHEAAAALRSPKLLYLAVFLRCVNNTILTTKKINMTSDKLLLYLRRIFERGLGRSSESSDSSSSSSDPSTPLSSSYSSTFNESNDWKSQVH